MSENSENRPDVNDKINSEEVNNSAGIVQTNPDDIQVIKDDSVDSAGEAVPIDTKEEFVKPKMAVYKKHKLLQVFSGVFSAVLIWVLLWVGPMLEGIGSWLWVIVFGIVFIGKNQIEKRKNIFFKYFTYGMLFGLIAAMALSALLYFTVPGIFSFAGM